MNSVAQQIFDSWIAENEIEVLLDEQLDRMDELKFLTVKLFRFDVCQH